MRVECERSPKSATWNVRLLPDASTEDDVRLDGPGLNALGVLVDEAAATDACRTLSIESASTTVFCRGMDLAFLTANPDEDMTPRVRAYAEVMAKLSRSATPTVCLVDGEVRGGGVGLAAACDAVYATGRASFALPELVVGLIPAMVMPLLTERLSRAQARWLALSGRTLDADDARRLGLVDEVVSDADAGRSALRRVGRSLRRVHPGAVVRLREFDDATSGLPIADALMAGAERTSADIRDEELLAGIAAMGEGELPAWAWRKPARDQT